MMSQAKVNVSVYLEPATLEQLRVLADRDGRSVSNFIGRSLETLVERGEVNLPSTTFQPKQIDFAEQIARKVKAGPVRKGK